VIDASPEELEILLGVIHVKMDTQTMGAEDIGYRQLDIGYRKYRQLGQSTV